MSSPMRRGLKLQCQLGGGMHLALFRLNEFPDEKGIETPVRNTQVERQQNNPSE